MKKLIYIIPILISCSAPMRINCTADLTGECTPKAQTFNTKIEAKVIEKGLEKHCGEVERIDHTLLLYPYHIECSRKVFFKERGFIRDKYRPEIIEFYE